MPAAAIHIGRPSRLLPCMCCAVIDDQVNSLTVKQDRTRGVPMWPGVASMQPHEQCRDVTDEEQRSERCKHLVYALARGESQRAEHHDENQFRNEIQQRSRQGPGQYEILAD